MFLEKRSWNVFMMNVLISWENIFPCYLYIMNADVYILGILQINIHKIKIIVSKTKL